MKSCFPSWLHLTSFLLVGAGGASAYPWPPVVAPKQSPPGQPVKELIGQLGSNRFAVREAATRALMGRDEALPAVRTALKSADAEVARRAAQILEVLEQREDRRLLGKLRELAKAGEVDLLAQYLVARGRRGDTLGRWQLAAEFVGRALDLAEHDYQLTVKRLPLTMPVRTFRPELNDSLKAIILPHPVVQRHGAYVLQGEQVDVETLIVSSLILSSGPVRAANRGVVNSVMLGGDSVEVETLISSVVICDGEFTARQPVRNCLIIARGAVHCRHGLAESLVITRDKVHVPTAPDARVENSIIKENEPNPLGLIKFFEPARVGIQVEAAEGGLKVHQLQRESPFARGGLQAGDVLIAVGGSPVGSPDRFRRTLRKLLAEGEEKVFRVRRAERVLELSVVCHD